MARSETIKIRVTIDEKEKYTQRAERAGTNVSELARALLDSEKSIIFLDDGAEIAKEFCSCHTLLSHFASKGQLSYDEQMLLESHMDEITRLLYQITDKLTEIEGEEK